MEIARSALVSLRRLWKRFDEAMAFVRWSEVVLGKVALGMIALLVAVLSGGLELGDFGRLLSLFACLGVFGYTINDWCDRRDDAAVGKPNSFAAVSTPAAALFFAALLLVTALVASTLFRDPRLLLLIGAQIGASVAYSAPPLRLKARGVAGLFAVLMAQYLLPVAIILMVVPTTMWSDWMFCVAFALTDGLCLEIGHQLGDSERDASVGVATFAVRTDRGGVRVAYRFLVMGLGALIVACPFYIAARMWQQGVSGRLWIAVALLPLQAIGLAAGARATRIWAPETDPFYGQSTPPVWRLYAYLPNCFIPLYVAVLVTVNEHRDWPFLALTLVWLRVMGLGTRSYSTRAPHYSTRWHLGQMKALIAG